MKIALAADHGGFELKEKVKSYLLSKGYDVLDLGCDIGGVCVVYRNYGYVWGESVV